MPAIVPMATLLAGMARSYKAAGMHKEPTSFAACDVWAPFSGVREKDGRRVESKELATHSTSLGREANPIPSVFVALCALLLVEYVASSFDSTLRRFNFVGMKDVYNDMG